MNPHHDASALLRWGILGLGHIAEEFADGLRESSTGTLHAVASRSRKNADDFGAKFKIARRYASYQELLDDPEVQAVYIATPHPTHAEWAIKAAEAGKHILCEKPLAMNWPEAMAMVDAARVHDVFLMEAFMYRCHPQIEQVRALIREGALGEVRLIRAAFAYHSDAGPENRAFAQELGGGGILDVGCYPVSLARLIAGAAQGKDFEEPTQVKGVAHLGATGVDEWASAVLKFPGDILAEVSTGVRLNTENVARVFGSRGSLEICEPWIPSRFNREPLRLLLRQNGAQTREIFVPAEHDLYTYEADAVAGGVAARQATAMSWDDSLGNMRVLDSWRREIGLVYESEKPCNMMRTITGRPLAKRSDAAMRYGHVAGVDKPMSRMVFGCDSNNTMPDTAIMLDDFFERGGNAFDTSCDYGNPNGAYERNLGQWIRNRGIRDDVVVIEKGANFPNDSAEGLSKELLQGLDRLQMDCVDIYMIHRDNERVPIGEWVEVLNEHLQAGRMKVFGLSNFSVPRLQAFKDYANAKSLQSFSAVSNQLSLAQVFGRIWDMQLVSSSDAASRAWFEETQTPLFPWSSQARDVQIVNAWPVAASLGASQHFIGERDFQELTFKNGLPWVFVMRGAPKTNGQPNPDDGTLVVVGDIGEEFGANYLPFRTARGLREVAHKALLKKQLAALPANAPREKRQSLLTELSKDETLSGATMTLQANTAFNLFDFYGNRVAPKNGKIVIPLDGRGFFLRGNGKPGSFARLVRAVRSSYVAGIEPLATVAHDMTAPVAEKPSVRLALTNVLNRPVKGTLAVSVAGLKTQAPATLSFKANETKQIMVRVLSGRARVDNTSALSLRFNAGRDGVAVHEEELHANVIARRTPKIDGDLSDWQNVLPQTIRASGGAAPSLTEAAWFPFKKFDAGVGSGFANGYLAYDAKNFYFAAKIADSTPDVGMLRFATRDDGQFFYPQTSYILDADKTFQKTERIIETSTQDARALQKPDANDRVLAYWETLGTNKGLALDLDLPTDGAQQVALYFLDVDPNEGNARKLQIEVRNRETNELMDARDLPSYRFGTYAVYKLSGRVRVQVKSAIWRTANLSGLFFDAAPSAASTIAATNGPMAQFLKFDENTQGSWKGVYGSNGHVVVGAGQKLPTGVSLETPEVVEKLPMQWPDGVRRYSYRKDPILPAGNFPNSDNVQIAFNAVPEARKPWLSHPPGTMRGFTTYYDTDYEYALNPVAPQYGGGTEIWRLRVPGMPDKHHYPRQGKSRFDGPVRGGKLVIKRDGNTRLVEAAIPWSEIPDVKQRLDRGEPIKFSFRVNDNAGGPTMELSKNRSVAKRNGSFRVDWTEHFANELEFGWER